MEPEHKATWCMFFCAVKSWQYHPGNKEPLSTEQCAAVADDMMIELLAREGTKWAGWQQRR